MSTGDHHLRRTLTNTPAVLDEAHFVNVSFVDEDGLPVSTEPPNPTSSPSLPLSPQQCLPMVHAIEQDAEGELTVYLHGYHKGRLMRLLPPESRVCITATLLDGLALALSAFHSSINHRSAVLHGEVVDWDETTPDAAAAKWDAAKQIVNHVMPGRWDNCRQPNKGEMATTGFLKVKILSASAKVRTGEPGEEKRDVEDDELTGRVWAGIVPTKISYGTPEPSAFNRAPVGAYMDEYMAKGGVPGG